MGYINAISFIDGKEIMCKIEKVLCVPELRHNLLSVGRLENACLKVIFNNGWKVGNLYEFIFNLNENMSFANSSYSNTTDLWHRRDKNQKRLFCFALGSFPFCEINW